MAVVLAACVGGLVAVQAPINSMLGKAVGSFQAAFVSFAVGTVVLGLLAAFTSGSLGEIRSVPAHYLIGGLLGAAYVTTALVTVRTLGAGGLTAAVIAGQLTLSALLDHFGWLGVERQPLGLDRLAGMALLAAGTFLIVRD